MEVRKHRYRKTGTMFRLIFFDNLDKKDLFFAYPNATRKNIDCEMNIQTDKRKGRTA